MNVINIMLQIWLKIALFSKCYNIKNGLIKEKKIKSCYIWGMFSEQTFL